MTLDELEKIYSGVKPSGPEEVTMEELADAIARNRRERLRAVVEALRDACYGCEHHLMWDEILASDDGTAAR